MKSKLYKNREHGFSLLEVLVALSLLAMLLGGLMRASSAALRSVSVTEGYQMAVLVANSVLAEIESTNENIHLEQTGTKDNRYHWRAVLKPYYENTAQDGMANPYEISIEVEWGEGSHVRRVNINTVRLLRS